MPMFVILLSYQKPLFEVDRFVAEHRRYLELHYAAGHFVLSGRKEPRTGGVILAQAASRADVQALVQQDPFYREGIAQYEVVEFQPSLSSPALAGLVA